MMIHCGGWAELFIVFTGGPIIGARGGGVRWAMGSV